MELKNRNKCDDTKSNKNWSLYFKIQMALFLIRYQKWKNKKEENKMNIVVVKFWFHEENI